VSLFLNCVKRRFHGANLGGARNPLLADSLSPWKQGSVTSENMAVQSCSKGPSLALCLPLQFQVLSRSAKAIDDQSKPAVRHIQTSALNGMRKLVHTSCVQSGFLTYMVMRKQETQIGIRENCVQGVASVKVKAQPRTDCECPKGE
jgi:hypothetical protein